MPLELDPVVSPRVWEVVSELVVIVVLFATGLRIDSLGGVRLWRPPLRLLLVAMPLTIAAVAVMGWSLGGMTVAGALLLGAVIAPTDPVLAGDVQVGPPLEGREDPVRFTLTAEAGLNDGLAFPFVYLALLVAAEGTDPSAWITDWVLRDLVYRIAVGAVLGGVVGWLLGRVLFGLPGRDPVARSGPGVIALAAVLLCYGVVELAEGYGFIGAFVAGVACRRVEARHSFHRAAPPVQRGHRARPDLGAPRASGGRAAAPLAACRLAHGGHRARPSARRAPRGGMAVASRNRPAPRRAGSSCPSSGCGGSGPSTTSPTREATPTSSTRTQLWALVAVTIFASTVLHGSTSFLVDRYASKWKTAQEHQRARPRT